MYRQKRTSSSFRSLPIHFSSFSSINFSSLFFLFSGPVPSCRYIRRFKFQSPTLWHLRSWTFIAQDVSGEPQVHYSLIRIFIYLTDLYTSSQHMFPLKHKYPHKQPNKNFNGAALPAGRRDFPAGPHSPGVPPYRFLIFCRGTTLDR